MTPLIRAPRARLRETTIETAPSTQARRAETPDELVTFFTDPVWRFASAQVRHREDAEDVVMETFAAAFRDFDRLLRADDQIHWLLGIARRKVADSYRKQYRRAEVLMADDSPTVQNAPNDEGIAAREALAALAAPHREVLILKYINGMSTEEISRLTRRSPAATNSLLQRGREALRAALTATEREDR